MRMVFLVGTVLGAVMAAGALAQSIEPGKEGELANFLDPEPGARVCFGRVYSAEHLGRHPRQKVTEVGFRLTYFRHDPDEFAPKGQRNYYFSMSAKTRGSARTLKALGECGPNGGSIGCGVECDGGGVSVTRRPGDRILVSLGEGGRIRMTEGCSEEENAVDLEAGEDDREFLLDRLPERACPPYETW